MKFVVLLSAIIILSSPSAIFATDEYAEETGRDCEVCHLDPSGGDELTAVGEGYLLSLSIESDLSSGLLDSKAKKPLSRYIRLIFGYLHLLTAFFWFGTILYVHLILKPAYASKGLPPGEVKVGLYSLFIIAVTGSVLTFYRIPAIDILFSTKFGILLLVKVSIFLLMLFSALFVVFFLAPRLKRRKTAQLQAIDGIFKVEELNQFDGKEGRAAYFSYQGEVYDVTGSQLWIDGTHMARHQAGDDLTEYLSQAPHDESKILMMPKIGKLSQEGLGAKASPPKLVFYFMAYMNLGFVFLIILILALWRWW